MVSVDSDSDVPRTDDDNVAERQEDARKFWEYHRLAEVVPEDDFVRGATIFIDLETSRRWAYEHAPANSGVWRPTPDSAPQAHRNVGSEIQEDANALTDQERVLNQLSDLQQTSLRYYLCRTHHLDAHRGDPNLFRKVLFSLGDALFEPFYKDQSFPRKTIWDHIKTLSTAQWQILCTCCLAAMTQGWDQSSMNGANVEWPWELNVDFSQRSHYFILGWLNAAPFFVGAILGSLMTDPIIDTGLGRRGAIFVGGIASLVPVVSTIFVKHWTGFMVCRMALGIGMGAKASVVPIYISEIAPEAIRGRMAMCWQLFDTFGILIGSIVNYIIHEYVDGPPSWKLMIIGSSMPAMIFTVLVFFCVESPRWLLKKNKRREALTAQIDLYHLPSPIIACGELYEIYRRLKSEEKSYTKALKKRVRTSSWNHSPNERSVELSNSRSTHASDSTARQRTNTIPNEVEQADAIPRSSSRVQSQYLEPKLMELPLSKRLRLLWKVSHIKRALRASQLVMAAQQACGINILAFMSTTMFSRATSGDGIQKLSHSDARRPLVFSIYFGLVNFSFTFLPLLFIDGQGRRALLKWSFPGMGACLLAAGGVLFMNDETENALRSNLFMALTLVFTAFFSIGEGPAAFVISSEIFPLMVRELGMSLGVFTNFFLASVLSFVIPNGLDKKANTGWFWIAFGCLNFALWPISLLFVYETSGDTLERINEQYSKSWKKSTTIGRWLGRFF